MKIHGEVDRADAFEAEGRHYVRVVYWYTTQTGEVLRHTSFCDVTHKADAERLAELLSKKARNLVAWEPQEIDGSGGEPQGMEKAP